MAVHARSLGVLNGLDEPTKKAEKSFKTMLSKLESNLNSEALQEVLSGDLG